MQDGGGEPALAFARASLEPPLGKSAVGDKTNRAGNMRGGSRLAAAARD